MSALQKLYSKPTNEYTPVEAAIVKLSATFPKDAHRAAAEFAALQAENERLKAENERMKYALKEISTKREADSNRLVIHFQEIASDVLAGVK